MIFKFDIKNFLLKGLCDLLKNLYKNSGNSNSGGGITKTNALNINSGNNNINININFITIDEPSKIRMFDKTIDKSINIITDDLSLWLYCNSNNNNKCFALGKYFISPNYNIDKKALWIGIHSGSQTEPDLSDKTFLKKNLSLIIEFLGKGWKKENMLKVAKKEKGDDNFNVVIERFEEKSTEELITFIKNKLEEALKDKEQ